MKISIFAVWKIEMKKLLKRKDLISLIAVLGIGLLLSVSVKTGGYVGDSDQSALLWMTSQILNSSILFIAPVIISIISNRCLSAEMSSGSISLYNNRIRNRGTMYWGKSLSVTMFTTILYFASLLVHLLLYYIFVNGSEFASGELTGYNTAAQAAIIFVVFFSSYLLISQLSLFLGLYFKQGLTMGIVFAIVLISHNTVKIPVLQYLNPWYYIARLMNVGISVDKIDVTPGELLSFTLTGIAVCVVYIFIINLLALRKIKKTEFN